MKKKSVIIPGIFALMISACSHTGGRYVELGSGKELDLQKDENTGLMVNKETGKSVFLYVDTKTNDTILGSTGKVVNGHVVKLEEGKYVLDSDEKLSMDEDGSLKYKDGDYKAKIEEDGDMKIKDYDRKIKIDGETDEKKVKND